MGRTALELMGQAGLGYSFDQLVGDAADDYGAAIKDLMYVRSSANNLHARAVGFRTGG